MSGAKFTLYISPTGRNYGVSYYVEIGYIYIYIYI